MNRRAFIATASAATMAGAGASAPNASAQGAPRPGPAARDANPLLQPVWNTPHGVPPFASIRAEHFMPAVQRGLEEQRAEVARIKANPRVTFTNTVVALDDSGRTLSRVLAVFYNLTSSHTSPELQALSGEIGPLMAAHSSAIYQDKALWARIESLHARGERLRLRPESARLLKVYHDRFVRAGAALTTEKASRVAEIDQRLSALSVEFEKRLLADTAAYRLVLETEADTAGLSETYLAGAAEAAREAGLPGKWLVLNTRSSVEPFLQASARRDLREKAWSFWVARGDHGDANDTTAIIGETVRLRAERAALLGFESHAAFSIANQMARMPQAASALMERVWAAAKVRAAEEAADIRAVMAAEGANHPLEPWDWRFYTEKVRASKYDLDQAEVMPFLQLDRMIEAVFDTTGRLFGLRFTEIADPPRWHADVRAWQVHDRDGRFVGVFYGDYFARPTKQSGAWMSSFRDQERLDGEVTAVVVNNLNYVKAPAGQPTLLTIDDVETLFHEFGHALHGLLSNVTYPSLSGTSVARDWVEFPAQVMEHWATEPAVLSRFAVHHRTGQPMPPALIERIVAASRFNQGFATVEFLASGIVDMAWHSLDAKAAAEVDVAAFEAATLARIGMPAEIVMRHRSTHFSHIFAGGYAAGYYAYLWAEVLDADAFEAFRERGDIFHQPTATALRRHVFESGGTRDHAEAYRAFRGRDPDPQALMRNRGFA